MCNAIIVVLSFLSIGLWYLVTQGVEALFTVQVYSDGIAVFTVSKIFYMLYEGGGKISFKKLVHSVLEKILKKNTFNVVSEKSIEQSLAPIKIVTNYLSNSVKLPLTDSQIEELKNLLK